VDAVRAIDLTRNTAELKLREDDALITKGKLCARTGIRISQTFDTLPDIQSQIQCPLLVLHGTEDKCTEISASLRFFQNVGTPPHQKAFVRLTGFFHELFSEVESEPLLDMVAQFATSGGTTFPEGTIGADRVMDLDLIQKE
jgi:alpha-beta hydrolase superfamily lysophospholipase